MYLAAIADSQPPQTAPLSQVLMLALLVSLALSDLVTPKLFSFSEINVAPIDLT